MCSARAAHANDAIKSAKSLQPQPTPAVICDHDRHTCGESLDGPDRTANPCKSLTLQIANMSATAHRHPPHHHPSLLTAIKDAILGDPHRDFTEGSIPRAITLLAIPMVLEMMMESLFAVVDVFWVAHLGSDAVATVGFTESLLTLLYAVAMGLSISAAATVARRIGEKNPDAAADVAVQSIFLGLLA